MLLIDANGTVGDCPSSSVGPCRPEVESENGGLLRVLCDSVGARICNTWSGGEKTYTGARGHKRRIDYVCVSSKLRHSVAEVWVEEDICLAPGMREDHKPGVATISLKELKMEMEDCALYYA